MTTMTFAFLVEGHGPDFTATLDVQTVAPALVPRLDPAEYRAAWVAAAAEELFKRAALKVRQALAVPDSCRRPPFIAVRCIKIFD